MSSSRGGNTKVGDFVCSVLASLIAGLQIPGFVRRRTKSECQNVVSGARCATLAKCGTSEEAEFTGFGRRRTKSECQKAVSGARRTTPAKWSPSKKDTLIKTNGNFSVS